MRKFYSKVVKNRKIILAIFVFAAIAGGILKPLVGVNYDMKDYLPEDSPSTIAMNVMTEEFSGGIPNARVMIKDVSISQALSYKEKIGAVDGVSDVTWLDDSTLSITMPLSFMESDTLDNYFKIDDSASSIEDSTQASPNNDINGGTASASQPGESADISESASGEATSAGSESTSDKTNSTISNTGETAGTDSGSTSGRKAASNSTTKGTALMSVTIEKDKNLSAVTEIREIIGQDNCMDGDAVSTAVATESTITEIAKIAIVSVLLVLLILVVTTRSWLEPLIILLSVGIAIIINAGTNIIFGEVSFVTNAAGSILQLAVSLDYSVFLMHRFEDCKIRRLADGSTYGNGDESTDVMALGYDAHGVRHGNGQRVGSSGAAAADSAMVEALMGSTGSIASSGLTTVVGFLALVLMKFQIGPDMGLALGKGIVISLITVFTFTPALILTTHKLIDRTRHRRFLPDFKGFGRFVLRIMIPMVCVFALLIVPSFIASHSNSYYYGASHIFGNDVKVGQDKEEIVSQFGQRGTYALMVPKGDVRTEDKMTEELEDISEINEVQSCGETVSSLIPYDILPDFVGNLLVSENYSRLVLRVEAEAEGDETFALVEKIRKTAEKYYGDDYLLAGEGPSTYDLMDTTTSDMVKVNIVAIAAVLLVLIVMLRSLILPVILVAGIETAIWINVAIPFVMDDPVFYIAYLIISSVQLGATVDYAILMTDRYREKRITFDRKDAIRETVASVTPSIMTSGSALVVVGLLMGILSTHGLLAQLGIFIGRGALCSLAVVFLVLPGLLYIFDRFCIRK